MTIQTDSHVTGIIKDTVNSHLARVRAAGPDNLVALCPFHDDSSPSFAINIHTGLWLCYACGEQGNFKSFLSKLGMSRDDIDTNYGRTLQEIRRNMPPPPDPTVPNVVMESNRHIPAELLGIFRRCPQRLLDEGFTEETLQHFEVGVDQVHNRITFPLRDIAGNLVGISGRALLDSQQERYKVYKEEYKEWELPPYNTDKSHLLWNAHVIHPRALRAELPTVIVEGFKGCMWVHQAGLPNVVALMTKRMSVAQQWILKDMGGPYILFPDNDDAGIDGVVKVCNELSKITRHITIVEYEHPQPTDVPLEDIPELVESATDYMKMMLGH